MGAKISGEAALERKLRTLPNAARKMIAPAMEQSAKEIVDLARGLAPSGSGDLRASIGWSWGDAPEGSMTLGTVRTTGRGAGNLRIVVYAGDDRAYYARWVEFGTRPHTNAGSRPGTRNPGTPARPYFFPAYRSVSRKVRSRISRAVNKSAKQVAAGG
jgi:HK97 gp10 family phage protein